MTVLFEWMTARNILGESYFNTLISNVVFEVLEIEGFDKTISNANRVPPFGNVVIYKKAPLALYQLLRITGEDVFIQYCREFLSKKGCYEWKEFIDGLEEYSKIDLKHYNNTWIKGSGVPKVVEEYLVIKDNRLETEKKLDYFISKYKKDKNYKELFKSLNDLEVRDDFSNKYYYYLSQCHLKEKEYSKAKNCINKLDRNKDIQYYWEGIFQKSLLELKEGNFEDSFKYIKETLEYSYPIKDIRGLFKLYEKIEKELTETNICN